MIHSQRSQYLILHKVCKITAGNVFNQQYKQVIARVGIDERSAGSRSTKPPLVLS